MNILIIRALVKLREVLATHRDPARKPSSRCPGAVSILEFWNRKILIVHPMN